MNSISAQTLTSEYMAFAQKVCQDHNPILIQDKQNPVVLISLEDYEPLIETNYLLKSQENATRLASAIDEIEREIAARKHKKSMYIFLRKRKG
jgi:antitoxin YefM